MRSGGDAGVRRLVETFYNIVEDDTDGAPLVAMHNRGHGLVHAREAQFAFLTDFLGGPQLYFEAHRHANVKRMHAHLKIGTLERDAWLKCMNKALTAIGSSQELHDLLMNHFTRVAETLRNHI